MCIQDVNEISDELVYPACVHDVVDFPFHACLYKRHIVPISCTQPLASALSTQSQRECELAACRSTNLCLNRSFAIMHSIQYVYWEHCNIQIRFGVSQATPNETVVSRPLPEATAPLTSMTIIIMNALQSG